ncbi:PAS domain-containing sensor histidine kinase [Sporomusa sp. KB1]|jgi:signal transduction histidine kinase|uniref:sensor histidine kinase n=1 Tax=Sporomusa sp. KB1 TaxID=943346 RepID=UPI001C96A2BC|nr:PAS domain-containing sensor histidine kinase [Sporomusa sp. KB1]
MIVIGALLLVTIIVLIVNYFNYQHQVVVADERARLMVTADYLDMRFDTRLVGLSLLAAHSDMRSLQPERVQPNLMAAAKALHVVNVALYDYNGNLISECWPVSSQSKPQFSQTDFKREFRSVLLGSLHVSDRMIDKNVEDAYVSLQVPVLDEEQVIAVLVAYIPISDISLAVLRQDMPERQYIFVLDGNRQFIHHPYLKEVFPESPLLKQQLNSLFLNRTGIIDINSPLDGSNKLLIYTDLINAHWRVATAIPKDVLYIRVLRKAIDDATSFLWLAVCFGLLYGVWRQARCHEREREQLRLERMICVNQLAAGIAHEIRNPLTSIKGFIQLMARHGDRPVSLEHLEIIISEIGRIDNLISEFQMLSRPLKEPLVEKINVYKLVNDVLLLMEGQFHNKNIAFPPQLPLIGGCVLGDADQLKQVFINLVKNALEATPVGGNVILAANCQQDMIAVTVENDGDGIEPEIIEKLGTPFFTTKANGTGLGLSVCYSIVQNHGGKIIISSLTGRKTVFTVLLPVAADEGVSMNK